MQAISTKQMTKDGHAMSVLASLVDTAFVNFLAEPTMSASGFIKAIGSGAKASRSVAPSPKMVLESYLSSGAECEQGFCQHDWNRSYKRIRGRP
jgi:hypothetical protein